jgi:amino acid permease
MSSHLIRKIKLAVAVAITVSCLGAALSYFVAVAAQASPTSPTTATTATTSTPSPSASSNDINWG